MTCRGAETALFEVTAGPMTLDGLRVESSAKIVGEYRYELRRTWWHYRGAPVMGWVMLNPSVADHQIDDQTIRRCMFYAKREGAGGIVVVNLFALRSTDPKALLTHPDPTGPLNDGYLRAVGREVGWLVAAWGAHKMATPERVRHVREVAGRPLFCLGTTKHGAPRHPSRLGNDVPLRAWAVS